MRLASEIRARAPVTDNLDFMILTREKASEQGSNMLTSVSGKNWQYPERRTSGSRDNGRREASISVRKGLTVCALCVHFYFIHRTPAPRWQHPAFRTPLGPSARAQPASLPVTRWMDE